MKQHLVRFDYAIKKLLRSKANFGILEGFLSELLGFELKIINLLENESDKEPEDDKYNKVNLFVKFGNEETALIEVLTNTPDDYFYKMLYGTSKIVSENTSTDQTYSHLKHVKKVYSVNILYFDFGKDPDYVYHGITSFVGIHNNKELYQKQSAQEIFPEYYVIKVSQFNNIIKNSLDEWIYFLKNEEIKEEFHAKGLLEAKDKLDFFKLSDAEKEEYEGFVKTTPT